MRKLKRYQVIAVFWTGTWLSPPKSAGDHEMNDQMDRIVETQNNHFTDPFDAGNLYSLNGKYTGAYRTHDKRTPDNNFLYRMVNNMALQRLLVYFEIR
tara:strand:- start:895 stop:1188 length:294 start_codon:yes stop_codon:yes gene_type:complete